MYGRVKEKGNIKTEALKDTTLESLGPHDTHVV